MTNKRLTRPAFVLLLLATVVTLGTACGDDDGGGSDGGASDGGGAAGTEITIKDFSFSPDPLQANVGDTITVQNDDGTTHTLTADDDSVDTGNIEGGASGTVTLENAGTLAYHCDIHPTSMTGTIEVSA